MSSEAGNDSGLRRRKSPNGVIDSIDSLDIKPDVAVSGNEHCWQQQAEAKRQKVGGGVVKEEAPESPAAGSAAVEIGAKNLFPSQAVVVVKQEQSNLQRGEDKEYDDIEIVERPAIPFCQIVATTTRVATNDEVEIIGIANQTHLPHLRQHCTEHPFVELPNILYQSNANYIPQWAKRGAENNVKFCELCYCYMCDTPAKDCKRWISEEFPTPNHNHCHAADKDISDIWPSLRQKYNHKFADIAGLDDRAIKAAAQMAADGDFEEPWSLPLDMVRAPVPPTDPRVAPYVGSLLWKCRKCRWYTHRGGLNGPWPVIRYHPDGGPWCYACGRIASEEVFIKDEDSTTTTLPPSSVAEPIVASSVVIPSTKGTTCQPYQPKETDIYLGTKTIPFRIKAHDPRKTNAFQSVWAEHEGSSPEWTYDEAEMEEDLFRHRLGTRPSLETILATLQLFRDDKIPDPEPGRTVTRPPSCSYFEEDDSSDDEDHHYQGGEHSEFYHYKDDSDPRFCAKYGFTDAILMEKNDRVIFQELWQFGTVGVPGSKQANSLVAGDITATWKKEERRGEFTVRLYFRQVDKFSADLSSLLGAWFGVFPFSLSDLAGCIKASPEVQSKFVNHLPLPPCKARKTDVDEIFVATKMEMTNAVATFNSEVDANQAKLSLQSSLGVSSLLGGVCLPDTSFVGVIRRYLAEMLPETLLAPSHERGMVSWLGRGVGVTAHHRILEKAKAKTKFQFRQSSFESSIRDDHVPLAAENLSQQCDYLANETKSINAILVHLENLGHEEAPFVEGLNVELLPFQRQTLQWALDRETSPGGLQSFLWAKLPFVEDEKYPDLYYSPFLKAITTQKPKLVKGGIIADEMGLGKTVISLALILQNPAPLAPESGTKSDSLRTEPNRSSSMGWDADWRREIGSSYLKGSILSRGTLVVCHVSLVGQWMEEAKRRLKDPGLVYAYHGQNRKRDAMVLAHNSIIVTTYATLAKDSSYHAKKAIEAGNFDYCPPCEQVRWWRIICDESHALKQETTQTKAVMSLVGDHKWAVSGTPWNTSLMDIKNQLKFVGLEHTDSMFSKFRETVVEHVTPRRRRPCDYPPKFGEFMFLMRAVMIRHAQNQQYRGTSTTLMSLPPKKRTVVIDFKGDDALEYAKIEQESMDFYESFKSVHWKKLSSHYLKLIQRLVPLRIACSGGRTPLVEDDDDISQERVADDTGAGQEDDPEDDEPAQAKKKEKRTKKAQVFSDFSFQSKVDVLMQELKTIRESEPDSKSLVFSQYFSSLRFLQEELPKHGFQFRTLSGDMSLRQRAEALRAFQNDPPTTIFLLSMRAGAVGINLTQANRVFLLEPALNPSLEAQAIGRVHRLGQTRPVEIVRLLMKDSIETKISQLVKSKYSISHASSAKNSPSGVDGSDAPNANAPIVGSMRTDKAAIMGGEFDFLFGVTQSLDQALALPDCSDEDENTLGDNGVIGNANDKAGIPDSISSGMI